MGKSTASCFKIISCAGESLDHDDIPTPEGKGSSDRRRWSFRKRSSQHRVLSNSLGSEVPSSVNKENPDSAAVNFSVQPPDLTVSTKPLVIQLTEEKTELPSQLDSNLSETLSAFEDDCKKDLILDEPSIIIIQTAIRRLLAQQVLLNQKNIIKLQAAVRGHIVRRHAVGTLRCIQSIITMQALVRARRAGRIENNDPTLLGKNEAKPNTTYTYVSIEKLLTNAFARQLMESTPRNKPINIKCDPSKPDTAWKWFERWMSASSVSRSTGSPESESVEDLLEENLGLSDGQEDILIPSDCYAESKDMKSTLAASNETSEARENLISRDSTNLDLHSAKSISSSSSVSDLQEFDKLNSTTDTTEIPPIEMKETDFIEVVDVNSLPLKDEKMGDEQIEAEPKKLSRKASNPAFVAAQSKFEEMTSAKLIPSFSRDLGVKTGLDKDKVSLSTDKPFKSTGNGVPDNTAASAATSDVLLSSECGTELSFSSTLDSNNRLSEAWANETEQEPKVSGEIDHFKTKENLETEADEKTPAPLEADSSFTNTNGSKIHENVNSAAVESLDSTHTEDFLSVDKKQEAKASDLELEVVSEASPRSHITISESQATPGSQISVKPKKNRGKKSDSSSRKSKSSSADKDHNHDSGLRIGLDQLQETKSGKKRNSLGSGSKPDHKEHEPRDSSSSNSLPSYMQVTESARAKAIVNGSPRSSPDVHDKDIYIKKRHSLPGSNERQKSPRIHRSLSQAQLNPKGIATHSPQDRKWRR